MTLKPATLYSVNYSFHAITRILIIILFRLLFRLKKVSSPDLSLDPERYDMTYDQLSRLPSNVGLEITAAY